EPAEVADDRRQGGRDDGLIERCQQQDQQEAAEDDPDAWLLGRLRSGGRDRPPPEDATTPSLKHAADGPFGLGHIVEADPDLVARDLAHVLDQGRHLLHDLLLLLGRAALEPVDRDRRHDYAAVTGSSSASRRFLGSAPTIVCAGWPFLKTIRVGIDMTPYLAAVSWFSSTLSLTMLSLSACSAAISSRLGAITRHGPHQGAQKSTRVG